MRTRNPWKLWQKAAAGATLVAVVGLGGVAAVSAANASSESGTAGVAGGGPGGYGLDRDGDAAAMADGVRAGGLRGAMALAGALHGDFVVQTEGTATGTRRLQNGSVTAISAGSLTVSSSDGYSGTYSVPTDLDLSGIAVGDQVGVLAAVAGDTATAISVHSESAEEAAGAEGPGNGQLPDLPEGMTPPNAPESAPQTS